MHLSLDPGTGPLRLADLPPDHALIVLDARDAAGALLQLALDAQGVEVNPRSR